MARQAVSASSSAPAIAAPSAIGCSTEYRADLDRITCRARASTRSASSSHGCDWASRSRYCPTVTSVRISSNTVRVDRAASAGSTATAAANSASLAMSARSPSRMATEAP